MEDGLIMTEKEIDDVAVNVVTPESAATAAQDSSPAVGAGSRASEPLPAAEPSETGEPRAAQTESNEDAFIPRPAHAPDAAAVDEPADADPVQAPAQPPLPEQQATEEPDEAALDGEPDEDLDPSLDGPAAAQCLLPTRSAAQVQQPPSRFYSQEDEPEPKPRLAPHASIKPAPPAHHETAVQRLTMPTAMRSLKKLEETQGNKSEWHIASGITLKAKRLTPDQLEAMTARLCTVKSAEDSMTANLHAVKLVHEGTHETFVSVKKVTQAENEAYMSELYQRCFETRQKTQSELATKYLQPLGRPKKVA